jgi:hypothetical protein
MLSLPHAVSMGQDIGHVRSFETQRLSIFIRAQSFGTNADSRTQKDWQQAFWPSHAISSVLGLAKH